MHGAFSLLGANVNLQPISNVLSQVSMFLSYLDFSRCAILTKSDPRAVCAGHSLLFRLIDFEPICIQMWMYSANLSISEGRSSFIDKVIALPPFHYPLHLRLI